MGTSTSYAYDIGGNPYLAQDGDGMTISLATSGSTGGSLPALLTPNGTANLATSMNYALSFAPTSVTGANGATQSMIYDGFGRPSYATSVDGAATSYTYAYNPTTQTASISTSTTTNGTTTTTTQWRVTTYDGFGRTIKVQTGHDSTTVNTVDTVYGACGCSPLGKVVKVSMPYGPNDTEVWTTYTYDGSGRQLTSTVPDGSVTTTSYSGNSVSATDPAGIWKTNVTDAFGNLVAVYEPDPASGSPTTGPATYYAYNGANQLVSTSMARGGVTQTRTFTYNGSDMLTETTPEAGTVTYTYDGNHHVTSRVDAQNQKTTYAYDSYERLITVQHYTWGISPQCSSGCVAQWNEQANQDVSYYYDTPVANDLHAELHLGTAERRCLRGSNLRQSRPVFRLRVQLQSGRSRHGQPDADDARQQPPRSEGAIRLGQPGPHDSDDISFGTGDELSVRPHGPSFDAHAARPTQLPGDDSHVRLGGAVVVALLGHEHERFLRNVHLQQHAAAHERWLYAVYLQFRP